MYIYTYMYIPTSALAFLSRMLTAVKEDTLAHTTAVFVGLGARVIATCVMIPKVPIYMYMYIYVCT
jgi:hypothetical protein